MKAIVVGLGVQGKKRRRIAGADFVASVDPMNPDADFRDIRDVPIDCFDAALLCVPDKPKLPLLRYLVENGKSALVEKPFWTDDVHAMTTLQNDANRRGVFLYTAYNHRFEPHFERMRDLLASGRLGRIYSCRMFYGNGTARLVRESDWRDQGAGVLPDLGSHLLDTCNFWFGTRRNDFLLTAANRFENSAPDHVVIASESASPRIELEMTLCMWRNHFTCDILAENGSAHISSLCKWGPATFIHRERILPSGHPPEFQETLIKEDPTWALEYDYFKNQVKTGAATDLSNDKWVQETLESLAKQITA